MQLSTQFQLSESFWAGDVDEDDDDTNGGGVIPVPDVGEIGGEGGDVIGGEGGDIIGGEGGP